MPPTLIVIVPVRDFTGMTRLRSVLGPDDRTSLSRELATRAATAARGAGLDILVVSSDPQVRNWSSTISAECWPDAGGGLSEAAAAATSNLGQLPWVVLHADLPLVDSAALGKVAEALMSGTVLVPSQDGGTNVIASAGRFRFMYGRGSFHKHFSAAPNATIISDPQLSIDIDTPLQLLSFPGILSASNLNP